MSRTILITGASSSFGQELISRLPNDAKIIAHSRSPLPKINDGDSRIINIISDFSNPDFLTDFDGKVNFAEIDEVVHFAASPMRMQNFAASTSQQLLADYQTNFLSAVSLLTKVVVTRKQNPRQICVVLMLTDMIGSPKKGEAPVIKIVLLI